MQHSCSAQHALIPSIRTKRDISSYKINILENKFILLSLFSKHFNPLSLPATAYPPLLFLRQSPSIIQAGLKRVHSCLTRPAPGMQAHPHTRPFSWLTAKHAQSSQHGATTTTEQTVLSGAKFTGLFTCLLEGQPLPCRCEMKRISSHWGKLHQQMNKSANIRHLSGTRNSNVIIQLRLCLLIHFFMTSH